MRASGLWLNIRMASLAAFMACATAVPSAKSSELTPSITPIYSAPADSKLGVGDAFEVRFGTYIHGVGSVERYTPDVSASIVSPRLNFFGVKGYWANFIPRLQLGGNLNLAGRTSFAYLDVLMTLPVGNWLFVEPFFGGAIHNGSLVGTSTLSDLGCRELFHVGGSIGVPVTRHWSVIGTFEHLSNGKGVFGTNCGTNQTGATGGGNQGLNNYGLRFSYAF
jgi:lipid A 3-O-deacylase